MIQTFNIFNITVPSYLLCAVLGFCAAIFFAFHRNSSGRIKWSAYYTFIVFSAIGMVIGSKLLFFVTAVPSIIDNFSFTNALFLFLNGGFVFYGGLLGALAGGMAAVKITKEDRRETFDLFIPPFILFHTFGRVGCFLTGCCYGIESPLGFSYPYEPDITRFPVQLAEAVGDLIIISILLYREKRYGGKESLTALYLLMYAPMRFLLEFLRGDSIRGILFTLSTSQWVSIFVVVVILLSSRKRHRSNGSQ